MYYDPLDTLDNGIQNIAVLASFLSMCLKGHITFIKYVFSEKYEIFEIF